MGKNTPIRMADLANQPVSASHPEQATSPHAAHDTNVIFVNFGQRAPQA